MYGLAFPVPGVALIREIGVEPGWLCLQEFK
jgi:hypothetical protein